MRTIKFRAWDVKNKCWHTPTDWSCEESDLYIGYGDIPEVGLRSNEYFIWCQFTGLKDKNGKEIYEGDLLKILDRNWPSQLGRYPELNHQQYLDSLSSICEVVYNQDRFELEELKGRGYYHESLRFRGDQRDIFEVIGNIYENLELLK